MSVRLVSDRPSALLSVRDCAERARVTERSVRRWIAEGKLAAGRTADGLAVDPADLDALLDGRADGRTSVTDGHGTDVRTASDDADGRPSDRPSADGAHWAALVDKLTQQNLELAGRLGFYQARLQQAEETIKALRAPAGPPRRPWWRLWG